MAEVFVMPVEVSISDSGIMSMKSNSPLKVWDPSEFGEALKREGYRSLETVHETDPFEERLNLTEVYLKLTKSITVTLIPGNDVYYDKKKFTWTLSKYDESGLSLDLRFENPLYISVFGIDTLKIKFRNANEFFSSNDSKDSLPDGFVLMVKVPPQAENLMTVE